MEVNKAKWKTPEKGVWELTRHDGLKLKVFRRSDDDFEWAVYLPSGSTLHGAEFTRDRAMVEGLLHLVEVR